MMSNALKAFLMRGAMGGIDPLGAYYEGKRRRSADAFTRNKFTQEHGLKRDQFNLDAQVEPVKAGASWNSSLAAQQNAQTRQAAHERAPQDEETSYQNRYAIEVARKFDNAAALMAATGPGGRVSLDRVNAGQAMDQSLNARNAAGVARVQNDAQEMSHQNKLAAESVLGKGPQAIRIAHNQLTAQLAAIQKALGTSSLEDKTQLEAMAVEAKTRLLDFERNFARELAYTQVPARMPNRVSLAKPNVTVPRLSAREQALVDEGL